MKIDRAKPIIHTEALSRSFGNLVAVDGLDLSVDRGEVFGFLGHNGAGKTTTVRLLNGALIPSSGRIQVLGMNPQQDGPVLRRRTGVLTENPSLEERLTGYENLQIYAALYAVAPDKVDDRVRELLEQFDLLEAAEDQVGTYSKGMKQRLALARALIHDPELLFLDEPTSGLDPVAARSVHELIQRMTASSEHTVFLCTHNLNEAQSLCDRVAVLEHGRLLALGSPAELAQNLSAGTRVMLEISPTTIESAFSLVSRSPGLQVHREGRQMLHIEGAQRDDIPILIKDLCEHGVQIFSVRPEKPTLEDVYFALHSSPDKETAA